MKKDFFEKFHFLAGYMDAVGRALTTDEEHFCIYLKSSDSIKSIESDLGCDITILDSLDDVYLDIEDALKSFFEVDPRNRLYFYLIEYIMWLEESAGSLDSVRAKLESDEILDNHFAWFIKIDDEHCLLIYMSRQRKGA